MKYKDAVHCYGMSLQTTPDLFKHSFVNQEHMAFPEFLEMIVRMGDLYFHEDERLNYRPNLSSSWMTCFTLLTDPVLIIILTCLTQALRQKMMVSPARVRLKCIDRTK